MIQMPQQQAPGQATPAALPSLLPQQNGATPPPQVGQLSQMPVAQLKQLFFQTMQGGTGVPPLSILAAIKQASERERMQQAVMGQSAQQQAAQQPGTIRDEVLAQAQGGIQALASGGPVQSFEDGGPTSPAGRWFSGVRQSVGQRLDEQREMEALRLAVRDRFSRAASPFGLFMPQSDEERARAVQVMRALPEMSRDELQALLSGESTTPSTLSPPAFPAFPADESRPTPQAIEQAVRAAPASTPPAPAPRAAPPGSVEASARTSSSTQGPAAGGLSALEARLSRQIMEGDPRLGALGQTMEANARDRAALLERLQGVSPELAAARQQFQETMGGVYEPQRKAAEDARAATRQGLLRNPEALARLAAAASGKKRIGEALGAAAGAAGEVMGERRKRAEQLESSYQTLQAQLNMTLAQARLADATGDDRRKQELLTQAQEIKERLAAAQVELVKTDAEIRGRSTQGLVGLLGARAQNRTAAAAEARAARDNKTQDEAQRYARLVQAINTSPLLKSLAKQMELMPKPETAAAYAAEERRLTAMLMPELLERTDTPPPGAVRVKGGN